MKFGNAMGIMVAIASAAGWMGTAEAKPTPQQQCDYARITAWKVYQSCVDAAVAKDAKGTINDASPQFAEFAAFAKCRHAYFKKWAAFQSNASLATSTCRGNRLTDNGTTVTDNLTGLVWEKKTGTVGGGPDSDPENVNNYYTWSASGTAADGTVFENFLAGNLGLNESYFAGQADWRPPTMAELQTTLKDFACTGAGLGASCNCGPPPCIDATFGSTQSGTYWSATSYVPGPPDAWYVIFNVADVNHVLKTFPHSVRAVRGGF